MLKTIHIRTTRRVGLEELTLREVTVLPNYEIQATSEEEALEEFYWNVPIDDHGHFDVEVI